MPSPSSFAYAVLLATPALAGNYPPPPGPYVNPAVQQWLAARTDPLLATAHRDAAAETQLNISANGEPDVSIRLISARTERQPASGFWNEPAANAPEQPDFRPIEPWAKPTAGADGREPYVGQPLRWREQRTDPITHSGASRAQSDAAPRQGLLDPLPAEPAYPGEAGSTLRRPEFGTTAPGTHHHRSTEELLALYLDYEPTRPATDQGHPGQAAARTAPSASKPESRRYYYRPTGTTFEFRALEREPREPSQARSGNAENWSFPSPNATSRR